MTSTTRISHHILISQTTETTPGTAPMTSIKSKSMNSKNRTTTNENNNNNNNNIKLSSNRNGTKVTSSNVNDNDIDVDVKSKNKALAQASPSEFSSTNSPTFGMSRIIHSSIMGNVLGVSPLQKPIYNQPRHFNNSNNNFNNNNNNSATKQAFNSSNMQVAFRTRHSKPRKRRTFKELDREFTCAFKTCKRKYASRSALMAHFRIKHVRSGEATEEDAKFREEKDDSGDEIDRKDNTEVRKGCDDIIEDLESKKNEREKFDKTQKNSEIEKESTTIKTEKTEKKSRSLPSSPTITSSPKITEPPIVSDIVEKRPAQSHRLKRSTSVLPISTSSEDKKNNLKKAKSTTTICIKSKEVSNNNNRLVDKTIFLKKKPSILKQHLSKVSPCQAFSNSPFLSSSPCSSPGTPTCFSSPGTPTAFEFPIVDENCPGTPIYSSPVVASTNPSMHVVPMSDKNNCFTPSPLSLPLSNNMNNFLAKPITDNMSNFLTEPISSNGSGDLANLQNMSSMNISAPLNFQANNNNTNDKMHLSKMKSQNSNPATTGSSTLMPNESLRLGNCYVQQTPTNPTGTSDILQYLINSQYNSRASTPTVSQDQFSYNSTSFVQFDNQDDRFLRSFGCAPSDPFFSPNQNGSNMNSMSAPNFFTGNSGINGTSLDGIVINNGASNNTMQALSASDVLGTSVTPSSMVNASQNFSSRSNGNSIFSQILETAPNVTLQVPQPPTDWAIFENMDVKGY
eukprot:Awhi_evm2s14121